MLEALESGCQSEAVFWAALVRFVGGDLVAAAAVAAEQIQSITEQPALKLKAEAPTGPRPPSAWNLLVTQTVSEMKQRGWQSWTTVEGVVWPGSKWAAVKDKKGVVSEQFVYASGEHEGKQPSPALGGMLRASYLKTQSDPAHAAKAATHRAARVAHLAEKRSAGSASASSSDAEGEVAKKRAPMTEEQKAAAKTKRAAKKAAKMEVAPIKGLLGGWAEE